ANNYIFCAMYLCQAPGLLIPMSHSIRQSGKSTIASLTRFISAPSHTKLYGGIVCNNPRYYNMSLQLPICMWGRSLEWSDVKVIMWF
ncbi:hypothetical protein COCC4DRAFT_149241, partial [Bipolaris maydis ATCC 48331]